MPFNGLGFRQKMFDKQIKHARMKFDKVTIFVKRRQTNIFVVKTGHKENKEFCC